MDYQMLACLLVLLTGIAQVTCSLIISTVSSALQILSIIITSLAKKAMLGFLLRLKRACQVLRSAAAAVLANAIATHIAYSWCSG